MRELSRNAAIRSESLAEAVGALVVDGGREQGSPGHALARSILYQRIESLGLCFYNGDSFELPYEAGGRAFVNVVGLLPGRKPELPPVLLAAHYDTCGPFPGAGDNAAAMAILLACVEPLRSAGLERSVVFAFFDAEEPPFHLTPAMGSIRFYEDQRKGPIHAAIVLDLCGHDLAAPGFEDLLFVMGAESDPQLGGVVETARPHEGIRVIATLNRYVGDMSDHHVFRMHERPYLFLSCGRWPHYHQPTDTIDKLNFAKMSAVSGFVESLTIETAQRDLGGPFEGVDPVDTELRLIGEAAGPLLNALGFSPRTRADIDAMVPALMQQMGF